MSWEDGLNAQTATTQPVGMTMPYTAGVNEIEAPPPATTPYIRQRNYDQAPQAGTLAGELAYNLNGRLYRCGRDQHYFECKHELRCECGMTERLPLNVQEGL